MFLYFLPGLERPDVDLSLLQELPIAPRLGDVLCASRLWQLHSIRRVCQVGPDRSRGLIVAIRPPGNDQVDECVGYFPDRQTWRYDRTAGCWVGWETLPQPEEIARLEQIQGYTYELGDGRDWVCPTLRYPGDPPRSNLPQTWGIDEQGNFAPRLHPDWQAAWELAGECWDIYAGVREIETAEAWDYCVQLLAINYRVGPVEVSALGLLTSRNYGAVFKAAIDGPQIEALLQSPEVQSQLTELSAAAPKKNEPTASAANPPSTSPGPPDSTPATAPAGESFSCSNAALASPAPSPSSESR